MKIYAMGLEFFRKKLEVHVFAYRSTELLLCGFYFVFHVTPFLTCLGADGKGGGGKGPCPQTMDKKN